MILSKSRLATTANNLYNTGLPVKKGLQLFSEKHAVAYIILKIRCFKFQRYFPYILCVTTELLGFYLCKKNEMKQLLCS